jgi:hypothetical protein
LKKIVDDDGGVRITMESTVVENLQCWKAQFSMYRLFVQKCRKLEVGQNFQI